jgi:cell division protein FtsW
VNTISLKGKRFTMIKKIIRSYDYSLIAAVLLLAGFGVVMIYSASMVTAVTRFGVESDYFFKKQLMWLIIGFVGFLATMIFPYKAYASPKILLGIVFGSIGVLILVFLIGHTAGNAQSWIKIGGMSLQPAEFVKLSVIIYLAAVYAKKQSYINQFDKAVLPPILFTIVICILVMIQPDFGTAFIIGLISLAMVICSGMEMKNLVKLIFLGLVALVIASPIILLNADSIFSKERMSRFDGFIDPFTHEDDAGYQLVNSYIAIGSGGLSGLGLGEGIQKYGYLPESHTDFIMAVIAEELGIFGVGFVLLLLAYIVLKGMLIARKCDDPFGSLLAIGISSMIGIQSFINLGGITGLIPITGVPLPFVSYGGSSLFLLMLAMGILVNVSMFVNYRNFYQSEKPKSKLSVRSFRKNQVFN